MSLDHNPKIVTDGLVFYYDMANTQKSWKGKPTINYLSTPTLEMTRGEFGQYYNLVDIFETYGLVPYSLSFDMKANKPGGVIWYMQNGSYTKYSFVNQSLNATTEWQRFKIENITPSGPTSDWLANTPTDNRAMLATYTGYGSGVNPTVKNMQLELGSFASPFVAGTRSNTQAILDLTKNNTITINSLTYNSNNTFSFNGINQTLETNIGGFGNNTTWIAWINGTENVSTINMFMGIHLPYFGFYGANRLFFSNSVNSIQKTIQTATNLSANTWYHAAFTTSYDGTNTTMKIYTNGIETATGTYSGYQTKQNIGYNFTIGDGHRQSWYRFDGQVPIVQIYNRTLTSDEVKQNFNAFRGRFNI